MAFHIEREIQDFAVLLRVFGEVDLNVIDDLRHGFDTALALITAPFPLVVDLEGVTFLSSAGLNELLTTDRRARELGATLRVVATRREVMRPLDITGLLDQLDVRGSVEDALTDRRHGEADVSV